jgi:hypothetical protein
MIGGAFKVFENAGGQRKKNAGASIPMLPRLDLGQEAT